MVTSEHFQTFSQSFLRTFSAPLFEAISRNRLVAFRVIVALGECDFPQSFLDQMMSLITSIKPDDSIWTFLTDLLKPALRHRRSSGPLVHGLVLLTANIGRFTLATLAFAQFISALFQTMNPAAVRYLTGQSDSVKAYEGFREDSSQHLKLLIRLMLEPLNCEVALFADQLLLRLPLTGQYVQRLVEDVLGHQNETEIPRILQFLLHFLGKSPVSAAPSCHGRFQMSSPKFVQFLNAHLMEKDHCIQARKLLYRVCSKLPITPPTRDFGAIVLSLSETTDRYRRKKVLEDLNQLLKSRHSASTTINVIELLQSLC
jgi:hypothetical protein